jgi:hypothetical protein
LDDLLDVIPALLVGSNETLEELVLLRHVAEGDHDLFVLTRVAGEALLASLSAYSLSEGAGTLGVEVEHGIDHRITSCESRSLTGT